MSRHDPYAPCPCGSDLKYKWCCQKVEADVERIERLVSNGQLDTALAAIGQSLARNPDNPSLFQWKVMILTDLEREDELWDAVLSFVTKHRSNAFAHSRLLEASTTKESNKALITRIHDALENTDATKRGFLWDGLLVASRKLDRDYEMPLSIILKALSVVYSRGFETEGVPSMSYQNTLRNSAIPPRLKFGFDAVVSPANLDESRLKRFEEGVKLFRENHYRRALKCFQELSAGGDEPELFWSIAVCQTLLVNPAAAEATLKKHLTKLDPGSTTAVDSEMLRQQIHVSSDSESQEVLRLAWPIRNRAKLLETLEGEELIATLATRRQLEADSEPLNFGLLSGPPVDLTDVAAIRAFHPRSWLTSKWIKTRCRLRRPMTARSTY